jgi:hypothetical protein
LGGGREGVGGCANKDGLGGKVLFMMPPTWPIVGPSKPHTGPPPLDHDPPCPPVRPPFFAGMSLANRVCSIARSVNVLLGSRHGMGKVRVIPQAERVDASVADVAMAAAGAGEDDAITERTIRYSGGLYFIGFLRSEDLVAGRFKFYARLSVIFGI